MANFKVKFIQHYVNSYVVEADNKKDAKEKAYDLFLDDLAWFEPDSECDRIEVEEMNDDSVTEWQSYLQFMKYYILIM